jgi:hypothetical protein
MQPNEDNLDWALERVIEMSVLPGAPTEKKTMTIHAKQLLKIVDTNEPCFECCGWEVTKGHNPTYHQDGDETAKPVTENSYRPGDRLVEQALGSFKRFPAPVELRKMFYESGRVPADGMRPPVNA